MLIEELLPDEVKKTIPPLYTHENNPNPDAVVRLTNPYLNWSWYIIEGQDVEDDYVFLGYAKMRDKEMGYFTLREISRCIGIERDEAFKPRSLKEIKTI